MGFYIFKQIVKRVINDFFYKIKRIFTNFNLALKFLLLCLIIVFIFRVLRGDF